MALIHASCVAISGVGVLIRGPSGAGKSDLALRLIDDGAQLVADDYCDATVTSGRLVVRPPEAISGKLEMRGFGILHMPHLATATVGLVIDAMPELEIERMPETRETTIESVNLPRLALDPRSASAAARVRFALRAILEEPQ